MIRTDESCVLNWLMDEWFIDLFDWLMKNDSNRSKISKIKCWIFWIWCNFQIVEWTLPHEVSDTLLLRKFRYLLSKLIHKWRDSWSCPFYLISTCIYQLSPAYLILKLHLFSPANLPLQIFLNQQSASYFLWKHFEFLVEMPWEVDLLDFHIDFFVLFWARSVIVSAQRFLFSAQRILAWSHWFLLSAQRFLFSAQRILAWSHWFLVSAQRFLAWSQWFLVSAQWFLFSAQLSY